ncbi:Argininosuccinate lyase [Variovorax sp. PBL-H6]|uniref:Bug family tripartite tricarboxylate transporter substrate binding protein n=1 Tax=Variovorax sp. PBL-H6 TaxID=434009 RepID=UPI00131962EC|nr:tripartite tricarboxylate transporter substrate binding protein [Variovorax sp. PBL-H6]VTU16225.1 Argininosuccinate lyase [Variovorax sp. PBL-H6]
MHASIRRLAMALLLPLLAAPAALQAQDNTRTIRLVVPFTAGGGADFMGREIGRTMGQILGQTVVIDNKAGASGIVGSREVAGARPDGQTLLLGTTGTHATNFATIEGLAYHPLNDFETVAIFGNAPFLLCLNPAIPATSLGELTALAKAQPGKLTHGSSGLGSSTHLGFEALKSRLGIEIQHVPYKGLPNAMVDVMGGQISMTMDSIPSVAPHAKSGRVRCIATGGTSRTPVFPELPTLAEAGVPGLEIGSWYGLFAPKGTPPAVVERLSRAVREALARDDMRTSLDRVGAVAMPLNPAQARSYLEQDIARWVKVAKDLNIRIQP